MATEASVTVLEQGVVVTIPLTVTPPIDLKLLPKGKFDETAFVLFLKERDGAKGDLNGDGIRNYVDEYIYTANYMARNGSLSP